MSFTELLNKTCSIYQIYNEVDRYGSSWYHFGYKYTNLPCRLRLVSKRERIGNGKEKITPAFYRLYLNFNASISTTDFVILNGDQYDILNINKCYGHHLEIDLSLDSKPFTPVVTYLAYEDGEIFYTEDLIKVTIE